MKKIILLILAMGCVSCSKAPALKVYTLDVPKVTAVSQSRYHNKIIKISYPESLRENMSQKMNFSYSLNDRGTYMNSQWSTTMSKLLQGTILQVLDESKQFKAVLSDTSTLSENYRLESNVFAFEHTVRGTSSYAVVSIQFTLINADTGKLVKDKRFSYQEATPTTDAKGYALATNVIMAKLSKDLIVWIR